MTAQRDGNVVALAFPYEPQLVEAVKHLPYAEFRSNTRQWAVAWCAQTHAVLSRWFKQGICATSPDELTGDEGVPGPCCDGVILEGKDGRLILWSAWRDDASVAKIRSLPGGAHRIAKTSRFYLSGAARSVLMQRIAEGVYKDPGGALVTGGDASVAFDPMAGVMVSSGDPRVGASLERFWPEKDVVRAAREHGVDVRFTDALTEEVYAGELARRGEGLTPEGLNAQLYPYQATAVAQACARSGLGLFLAPGLGKTVIGIATGMQLLQEGVIDRVVITPPAGVREQWAQEIRDYTGCDEDDVVVVYGPKRAKLWEPAMEARWVIVHHDILSRDLKSIEPLVRDQMLIIDEAHKGVGSGGKGGVTKRGAAMRKMASLASRRLALTGTPVVNSPLEWFRLLNWFIIPGALCDEMSFKQHFQFPRQGTRWNNRGGRKLESFTYYDGARNLEELRDLSAPHFVRWTKEQVAQHLPPLDVRHVRLIPDPAYRTALVSAHERARKEIAENAYDYLPDDDNPSEMTAVSLLRAMCSSPRLVHASDSPAARALVSAGLVPDVDGPKLDELRAVAAQLQAYGERAVVFTYSRTMLHLIEERCREDGIRFVSFHGQSTQKQRDDAVKRFTSPGGTRTGVTNATDEPPTLFLATDAAAEGLNLGAECGMVINFDLPWTPGRLEQRSNRVHRVNGKRESYEVMNLTVASTIEEGILRMVEDKAGISDVLFGERRAQELTGRGVPNFRQDLSRALGAVESATLPPGVEE